MSFFRSQLLPTVVGVGMLFCQQTTSLNAEKVDDLAIDFVIHTDVFAGRGKTPVESHVTLFTADRIYDVRTFPDRMTIVFDRKSKRFHISRAAPRMQTSLAADDVIRFSASLQAKALEADDPLIQFAATPKFEQDFDSKTGKLALTSKLWEYHVESEKMDDPDLLERYREFADWFTYLNSLFRPLPPGLRLELNRVLIQHSSLPKTVRVTLRSHGQEIQQRSEHQWSKETTSNETRLVKEWQSEQQTSPIVDFARFHQASSR